MSPLSIIVKSLVLASAILPSTAQRVAVAEERSERVAVAQERSRAVSEFGRDKASLSILLVVPDAAAGPSASKRMKATPEAAHSKSAESKSSKNSKSGESSRGITAVGPRPLAPFCSDVRASCSSGDLLEGVGPSEKNTYSDTIDHCEDGTQGTYLVNESVEMITVSAVDGQLLQAGGLAKIEAVVFPWDCPGCSSDDFDIAHFYYTNTVNFQLTLGGDYQWEYLGNSTVAIGSGLQTLEKNFTLDGSGIQAVRVNFGPNLKEGSCRGDGPLNLVSGGVPRYVDHDDLAFSVAKEVTW